MGNRKYVQLNHHDVSRLRVLVQNGVIHMADAKPQQDQKILDAVAELWLRSGGDSSQTVCLAHAVGRKKR